MLGWRVLSTKVERAALEVQLLGIQPGESGHRSPTPLAVSRPASITFTTAVCCLACSGLGVYTTSDV